MTLFPSENPTSTRLGNLPELSVTDLAGALKRTLEDAFGRVRVRGELSKVATPASGHIYTALKDDNALIDAVCWRTQVSRLKVKPEEGLDVIITGKITTYPARSSYQLVIEQIELAGVGAILKMIEDRRIKLAAEGLFDAERKRPLPFAPRTIGIITSPTGAVIRDILHRLSDRFPVEVLVWPVVVQGETAAVDVTAAINGFNALPANGPVPRPDILIVARGGGSIEDLMPFNDEALVRAAAASEIPLISAVGHETDTTLIDYAADQRAPTPTAAAEFAVPVRDDLIYTVQDTAQRLHQGIIRRLRDLSQTMAHHAARLGRPDKILELPMQRLDHADISLTRIIQMRFERATGRLNERAARLKHPTQIIAENTRVLALHHAALMRAGADITRDPAKRLDHTARMLKTLSFNNVLARGFALVRDQNGHVVRAGNALNTGDQIDIQFGDGTRRPAKIN